ncbi:hypothetical protein [Nostoc sp.]|uniref:hypothetical protein n=1 Tax=Nostoc sp. TaxID=1180 RepID=UPI002FF4F629
MIAYWTQLRGVRSPHQLHHQKCDRSLDTVAQSAIAPGKVADAIALPTTLNFSIPARGNKLKTSHNAICVLKLGFEFSFEYI